MPSRKSTPVTADELKRAVLTAIVREFGDRPLDIETARLALSSAAFDLNMAHIRESEAAAAALSQAPGPDAGKPPRRGRKS